MAHNPHTKRYPVGSLGSEMRRMLGAEKFSEFERTLGPIRRPEPEWAIRLEELRQQHDFTYDEVSEKTHIAKKLAWEHHRGLRVPSAASRRKYAILYHIDPAEITP